MDKSFAQIPVRRFHKSSYQLEGQLSFDVFMIKLVWIENVVKEKNWILFAIEILHLYQPSFMFSFLSYKCIRVNVYDDDVEN